MAEQTAAEAADQPGSDARPAATPVKYLSGVVLDSPDPRRLCGFYERLLGWERTQDEPDWCKLMPPGSDPGDTTGLSFQLEPNHRPPTWPSGHAEQMQVHLDFFVEDLDDAVGHAASCGATLMDFQPQDDVRVMADPDGHVFCLFCD